MTNTEYEKASVEAALGQRKLAAVDAKITETEQALVYLLHQRREIVNQYDLNKDKPIHRRSFGDMSKPCSHDFEQVSIAGLGCVIAVCRKCGLAKGEQPICNHSFNAINSITEKCVDCGVTRNATTN